MRQQIIMQFSKVVGQDKTKQFLINEVKHNRVSHAQLFLGPEGSGKLPLAIAFSQFLLCDNPTKTVTSRFSLNCPIEHLLEAISTLQSDQITLI